MKSTRADKRPIAITLLAGALSITMLLLVVCAILHVFLTYYSMFQDVASGSNPPQIVEETEAR